MGYIFWRKPEEQKGIGGGYLKIDTLHGKPKFQNVDDLEEATWFAREQDVHGVRRYFKLYAYEIYDTIGNLITKSTDIQ